MFETQSITSLPTIVVVWPAFTGFSSHSFSGLRIAISVTEYTTFASFVFTENVLLTSLNDLR